MQSIPVAATRRCIIACLACVLCACAPAPGATPPSVDELVTDYVRLALAFGALAPQELDFYFGPDSLRPGPTLLGMDRTALAAVAREHRNALAAMPEATSRGRARRLLRRYDILLELMAEEGAGSFAERVEHLYGLAIETPPGEHLAHHRAVLDASLPGTGPLGPRLAAWQRAMVIPEARRQAVFETALAECRRRTSRHWALPDTETLALQWHGAPAAAWHSYQGNYHGMLAIDTRALAHVSPVVDLACHEGYPGHQAQFLLQERAGMAVEDTLALLRAPDSVLREGAAMLAARMAFSTEERLAFERDVLFPLAGLDPGKAATGLHVHQALEALQAAIAPILAAFLDGELGFPAARMKLESEALVTSAPQLLEYAQRHGAYVAGYTLQAQALRETLEQEGSLESDAAWRRLREILTSN